jgi:predicted nucleic acid-binding protein
MAMSIFVDTSALLAVLDAGDSNHPPARAAWELLVSQKDALVSTNYVIVETFALSSTAWAWWPSGRFMRTFSPSSA